MEPLGTKNVKPKLTFVWSYLEWGGANIYLIGIMKVAAKDWDITVFLPRDSSPEIVGYVEKTGAKVRFLQHHLDLGPAPTLSRKLQRQWRRIRSELEVFRTLSREDLDGSVLHIETAPWQSWILLSSLLLKGAHIYVTLHNALPPSSRWRMAIWKKRMRFVTSFSNFGLFFSNHDAKDRFRPFVSEKAWGDTKVTYTAVDRDQIQRARKVASQSALRERFGISRDAFVVLCVAQFIDRKGRWDFLEAASSFTDEKDVVFVWLTPGEIVLADLERIDRSGVGTGFRLIRSADVGADRLDILSFFTIADLFVHPSIIDGLPISILEAMALGLPTISTLVYAIPEAVIDSETGVLVRPHRPDQLIEAIERLRRDSRLRLRLAAKGQEYVLENFDEHAVSQIAVNEYKRCLTRAN